jgi:transcriptional regulator with XRE-family HTH domain
MREDELTTISSREVGARMRRVREKRGLSAAEVAKKIGVTEAQLDAWEVGQGVAPFETIRALATALGTTPDAFVS